MQRQSNSNVSCVVGVILIERRTTDDSHAHFFMILSHYLVFAFTLI